MSIHPVFRQLWPALVAVAIGMCAWLAYRPGLSGGFQFDDLVNLDALGKFGVVDDWPTFWRYITSGTADPTGRPLALLSFLLDARDWPAAAEPFLQTNLLLHLLNGALLFLLLRRLEAILGPRHEAPDGAALIGAACWLLHPLFVSTTLYIVQREAMLPATFVLIGLSGYVAGRWQYQATGGRTGFGLMLSSLLGGTVLALLCKANGVLLPLLAAVLEFSVLREAAARSPTTLDDSAARRLRRLQWLVLGLPCVVVLAYLAAPLGYLHADLPNRPWTVAQRLLTEPRVIAEYLHLLVVPRSVSTGLFNDDFQASTGLLQPASTVAAAIFIIALSAFAVLFRKRWPALSAAIGFYLAGQLLESTTLPLELYFEHRNYLPAMLLFWPLGRAIAAWRRPAWMRVAVATAILLVLASTTWSRARIWGQPDQLAALWAIKNPESSRAQAALAIEEHSRGGAQAAAERLAMELAKKPDDLQLAFNLVDARCGVAGIGDEDRAAVTRALQSSPTTALMMFQWLSQAVDVAASDGCKGLTLDVVQAWIDAAMRNPVNADPSSYGQDIQPLLARLALARQQPDTALAHFDLALRARVRPAVAARQAAELASSGYYEQALAHLDTYERLAPSAERPGRDMSRVHEWVLERQHYWPREIATLRTKLHAAIRDRR